MFYEVTRRMLRLYHSSSIDGQTVSDFQFIDPLITDPNIQLQIAPRLLSLGLIELCQHICRKMFFHEKLSVETDKEQSDGTTAALTCLGSIANLTDISVDACHRCIDIDLHEDVFRFLNLDSMDPSKVKLCANHSYLADSAMSVVYNVIQASQQFLYFLFFGHRVKHS